MRIFRVVVVVLVFFSALTIWRSGLIDRGELQTLQAPGAETPGSKLTPDPTSTPEPPGIDTTMPTILSITLSPDSVNTLAADQRITVTAHITDDLSGFRTLDLRFVPASGGTQYMNIRIDGGDPLSGDKRDGVFWGYGILPQHSVHGRWYITAGNLADEVMNGCGEGDATSISVWEPCQLAIELPYFINGQDSGPPVIASPEPAQPSSGESADQEQSIFLPAIKP